MLKADVLCARGGMQFIKVKDLVDKFANESADVVGVVDKVEPAATITTKDGREVGLLRFSKSRYGGQPCQTMESSWCCPRCPRSILLCAILLCAALLRQGRAKSCGS